MKNKNIDKALKVVKDNRKPILIIAGIIVLLLVIRLIVNKSKKIVKDNRARSNAENVSGTNTTPGLNFAELRLEIFNACNKGIAGFLTDEDAIYGALGQLRTQADWEFLKNTWLDRMNELGPFYRFIGITRGVENSLVATLKNELSSSEIQHCREILTSKGINPGF